jgi:hypothetical protein
MEPIDTASDAAIAKAFQDEEDYVSSRKLSVCGWIDC